MLRVLYGMVYVSKLQSNTKGKLVQVFLHKIHVEVLHCIAEVT